MRVLVVTKIYPNAAEPLSAPFNRQQVAALARRCSVEVLATVPWFPGAAWVQPGDGAVAIPDREVIDGIQVVHPRTPYVPRYGHALSAGLYAATIWPELRARRDQFDVMLGCWAYPDGVAVATLGQALDVPTVVKVHGSDLDVLSKRPSLRWQMARTLPRADRLVAVSRSLVDSAVALGVDRARIDLVMNGVDTSLFHPRDRAEARAALGHAGDRRRWIVCVSRLREDKGTLDLVAAFTALAGRARGPGAGAGRRRGGPRRRRERAAPVRRPGHPGGRAATGRGAAVDGRGRRRDAAQPSRRHAERPAGGAGLRSPGGRDAGGRHPRRGERRGAGDAGARRPACRAGGRAARRRSDELRSRGRGGTRGARRVGR